ncbi:MAG: glycosyltransferase family 2 protein [Bryobacteraceae bacterium]|nr:glycosyltransferase family 2 protein [Bryobacteraceae bacterium]
MFGVTFCFAAAFVLYTLAGYPLLLAALARIRPRSFTRAPIRPTVSILLPVYNGEAWLRSKLESILALDYPPELLQILVISDGSTDRTETIASEFEPSGIQLIRIPHSGKAAALNAGLERATGEILFFTDVRQPLDRHALARLVECFADPEVGAATGELIILEGQTRQEADTGLYWRYEKWIRRRQSAVDSVLGATGCIYAMRRQVARSLPPGTINDDMYLPLHAFLHGCRIVLEDSARAYDVPASLRTEFRRKVRTLAGVYQIMRLLPALLGPSNRMWFHFASHKLARQLLPWALLAMAASSFGLPSPWSHAALAAQAGFCLAAALDPLIPERHRVKPLTSAPRTFLVLMAAAALSVYAIFLPVNRLWKDART